MVRIQSWWSRRFLEVEPSLVSIEGGRRLFFRWIARSGQVLFPRVGMRVNQLVIGIWFLSLLPSIRLAAPQDAGTQIQELYTEARNEEQQGQLNAAVQKYQAILKLNPRLAPAYNNLGRLYFQQARYAESIKVLKCALALDSKLASSHA